MNKSTLVPREEMSDLDWLARNVHVWKLPFAIQSSTMLNVLLHEYHANVFNPATGAACQITKAKWLARRAELQNKPSWKDAPEWAHWLGQVDSGEWEWYGDDVKFPPTAGDLYWHHDGQGFPVIGSGEVLGDWRDTLERRPEQAEFEPFVSVEDAKPKCGASMDVAFNNIKPDACLKSSRETCNRLREEMEKEDAATAKQPAPKGSGSPILGMVLADLTNRALEGKEKYGEPLLAHNGRNPLWDAYQEALDLAMYLRQAIEEQK